ncbi:MAG: hypothetical protein A3F84_00360 [Candidatus Handelsmanbacteria bacterium RIFCSPLOWO2_12_FULL_64_10]|uniref:Response regulatory domain-containing protein n=1 Tax=Handelsmanbacteria sp. (strain RIFCSPLOWO2_12_FULL_64_10) TaxID=1817868 RepID=A0A1F6CCG2_HANXR|nr:MAG: hypothetical protein A3F84_00360 [Candidatus Handelsmanbacteria bacterium RIFCSPLOWO2_12_FULL_64_10]
MALILVVDDDASIRVALRQILERAGHRVVDAPDGETGLNLYRQGPADLVITDLMMPSKEGVETTIELRQEFPDARVIAISGVDDISLLQASAFGALRVFRKPLDTEKLLKAVEEILESGP